MELRLNKKLALIFCILFIVVSALSLMFIFEHGDHDCIGVDCSVCLQISVAQNLLKQIGIGLSAASVLFAAITFAHTLFTSVKTGVCELNPILLKVRLNN